MYNVPSSSHEWLKRHMQREHTKVGKGIATVYVHVCTSTCVCTVGTKISVVFSYYGRSTV